MFYFGSSFSFTHLFSHRRLLTQLQPWKARTIKVSGEYIFRFPIVPLSCPTIYTILNKQWVVPLQSLIPNEL